ncbi:MAG TPA: ABC transporter permease [Bacteroidales bacterium]|nr:ABC transporter permease [Bacteroidales bacterium]
MITQWIYLLLRKIGKDKILYSIIFLNLVIGFGTFIIISQFISGQFTYDKHNKNYDRIYRLQLFMDQEENSIKHTWSVTAALSRNELTKLPEIDKIALLHDAGDNNKSGVFLSKDKKNQVLVRFGYYADQTVFDIFTFDFLEGNPVNALDQPYSIVLSKNVADRIFQGEKALGKQVYGENKVVFTVSGVYEDIPQRSTWRPAFLISTKCLAALTGWKNYETNYRGYSFYTYVLLKPNADPANVDNKIFDSLKDFRKEHHPYLRPMSKLQVNPYFESAIYIVLGLISFLSLLILSLSSINYINLQTANATNRLREIGVKKTVGFDKKRLWSQFMFESVVTTVIAAAFGLLVAQLFLPSLNNMFGSEIFPPLRDNYNLIIIIAAVALATGFISGIHPAWIISSFNPVAALRQKFLADKPNGISLRKILVTAQFAISVFMLMVAFIIYRQTNYMLTRDMGFNSESVLFANIVTDKKGSLEPLRQRLLEHPEIKNFCVADYVPFILPGGDDMNWEGSDPNEKVFVRYSNVNADFVPVFGLQMAEGRNFSREFSDDRHKCLLNETAVRVFGWKEPVGMRIRLNGQSYEVAGVIKDYIVSSVFSPIEPHLYRLLPDSVVSNAVYAVSFSAEREKEAMKIVRQEFEKFFVDDAFDFRNIQLLVKDENAVRAFRQIRKITGLIAILTIIISSIGLFGLILFITQKRMKEIGIRKMLGFSAGNLYYTMSSEFLRLILISIVIAWPAAFCVYRLLPGAGKYTLQIWEFLLATAIIIIVAAGTISFQIIRALRVRPTEILKDE